MPGPLNFDAFLGWVNVTDPNNIPPDARVLSADDLLRYEKLGVDAKAKFQELEQGLAALDSDTKVAESLAAPTSATRAAVAAMVNEGVLDFQEVIDAVPSQVQAQVPPLVSTALAADPTVSNAAAAAVNGALGDAGIVRGAEAVPTDVAAFSITDQEGRRSFLEIRADGRPTDHSAGLIADAVAPTVAELVPGTMDPMTALGYTFAIVDENDRVAFAVREDGSTTVTPPKDAPVLTPVIGWGTSMMHGTTGNGTTLMTALADELQVSPSLLINKGKSGMKSSGIAARHGGKPVILTVVGSTIPASGAVEVNAGTESDPVFYYWHTEQIPGTIAGVKGTLSYPNSTSGSPAVNGVFTRTGTGDAVLVKDPRPFIPDAVDLYPDNPIILWNARNNMDEVERIMADYELIIKRANHHKIIILSENNGSNYVTLNNRLASQFPNYFVDLAAWLKANGLASVGIAPTATDLADIAADRIPSSLLNDPTHLNAAGYRASAKCLAPIIRAKGWL